MVISFSGGGIGYAVNVWQNSEIPSWVWVIIAILGIFVAQFLAYHQIASRLIPAEQIEKTLKRLGELRVSGVNMRNKGMKLKTKGEVANWINEVNTWHDKVISEIEKISLAEAEIFRTVDIIKTGLFQDTFNANHQKYLRVLSDRTENIKKLVQRFTPENLTKRYRIEK